MTALRRATTDDLDAIMAIERATFPDDAWSTASMRSELEGPHGHYLVAVDGDRDDAAIVGYAGLLAPEGAGQGDVQTIAVAESARGRGVGRALLEATFEVAREAGAQSIDVNTGESDLAARALYEKLGFTNREGGPDDPRMLFYEREI